MIITDLSFEDWVLHVFDHPVADPAWHWDDAAPYWKGPPAVIVDYVTQLCDDPVPPLVRYTDAQLNQGFWYLASNGLSDMMFALSDATVPLTARVRCVRAFTTLFRQLFAVRCTPHLSHKDEHGSGPLNLVCYMWWDLLPFTGSPEDRTLQPLDQAALDVMTETLALDAIACQESALHGLGHWHLHYPHEVAAIVDRFVHAHPGAPSDLLDYARSARSGCVA